MAARPIDIPRFGASRAWRTDSSNSCLDIRADTNWLSALKYSGAFGPNATLSCPWIVDVDESDIADGAVGKYDICPRWQLSYTETPSATSFTSSMTAWIVL